MSNELTTVNNNFPSQVELQSISLIARTAQASGLYGGVGGEAKIMMVLLAAKELGMGPCVALNGGIWNINGKIEVSSRLMNGMIRKAGHSITVIQSDNRICTLKGKRNDGDTFECSFTIDEAAQAGLASRDVWKKYTSDMLYNRCMSRLARRLFPDVIGTAYVEGEIRESQEVEKLQQAECEDVTNTSHPDEITPPPVEAVDEPKISADQLHELDTLFIQCDNDFVKNFYEYMKTQWSATSLTDIPAARFATCKQGMQNNIEKNKAKAKEKV